MVLYYLIDDFFFFPALVFSEQGEKQPAKDLKNYWH
jgi:hypothetical protein